MPVSEQPATAEANEDGISSTNSDIENDSKDDLSMSSETWIRRFKATASRSNRPEPEFRPPPPPPHPLTILPELPWIAEPIIQRVPAERWRSLKPLFADHEFLTCSNALLIVSLFSVAELAEKIPSRLAINSRSLIENLNGIFGNVLSSVRNVLIWPFKPLIVHEDKIRALLHEKSSNNNKSGGDEHDLAAPNYHENNKSDHWKPTRRERDEIKCLVSFMDIDLKSSFEILHKIQKRQVKDVAFIHLWFLFKPGDLVFARSEGHHPKSDVRAYRVLHTTGARFKLSRHNPIPPPPLGYHDDVGYGDLDPTFTSFKLNCVCIEYDGYSYGPSAKDFIIAPYSGTRPIISLDVYPAKFCPGFEGKKEMLLQRGARYVNMGIGTQKQYSGRSIREEFRRSVDMAVYPVVRLKFILHSQEVDGRVIIDQELGISNLQKKYKIDSVINLGGSALSRVSPTDIREMNEGVEYDTKQMFGDAADDDAIDLDRREQFINSTELFALRSTQEKYFEENFLILLPWRIYGYALTSRKWLPLHVDYIKDMEEPEDPNQRESRFGDLVLPRGHKQLLEALVKYQSNPTNTSASRLGSLDVIRRKGNGLIILLHGSPGVGKTSTAECVASELNRPLLPITCGDLGDTAITVESQLEEFCFLAEKWNCVLLLDEADVFLSKREKGDFFRNSLVSVFLRTIEYYPGVLILTTNRVGEIDEAFRSRIHICLFYPKLDQSSTFKIWEKYIARLKVFSPAIDVDEDNIRQFYEGLWQDHEKKPSRRWNGRQIKNAFQTALAFAEWEFREKKIGSHLGRPVVCGRHFRKMAITSAHFDDYFAAVHGLEQDDAYGILAAREEIRTENAPLDSHVSIKDRKAFALARKSSMFESDSVSEDDEDPDELLVKSLEKKLLRAKTRWRTKKLWSCSRPMKDILQDSDDDDND